MLLVDVRDLVAWADRRDAQSRLPQFLRRLIHATVEKITRIGLPAGESVSLGGWDGIVVADPGTAFVPTGTSVWELSAEKKVKAKADKDYEKRRSDPQGVDPSQSTFVFVTLRRWGGKEKWAAERRREGVWRDVRAYDADDLEQWFETAPAVHVWLSILIGTHPGNADDLESYWQDWSQATQPAISPDLVLAGRSEIARQVGDWLNEPTATLALRGESRDEAIGVFAAALHLIAPAEREVHLSRIVIVRDLTAWHRLTASSEPLLLIPLFDAGEAVTRAVRCGHRVVVPLGRSDAESKTALGISRLDRREAEKALVASGIAEDRARDLSRLARRSITSFRRKLADRPEVQQPAWARPEHGQQLVPAVLAGAWFDTSAPDQAIVAALAPVPYPEVRTTLVRWSNENDAPVRHVGEAWYLTSKEDAWSLLSRYISDAELERFQGVVFDVLSLPDPRFDLPNEKRWIAAVFGKTPRHSGLLREGLADTLALLGARGDVALGGGATARDYAARIISRLLSRANTDWRVWASLSGLLPLLAEGAPDMFLAAIEDGLALDESPILRLFSDREGNLLFDSSPHTGLLWALETLAWSPDQLGRAAILLAKLARRDPGGHLRNRPQNSLRDIFLLWHPQSAATLETRLQVIDRLRQEEPEAAWRLCRDLLPEFHGAGHSTVTPRWREWNRDAAAVTNAEYLAGIREIVTRMIEDAHDNGERWRDIVERIASLPADQHDAVVSSLAGMDITRLNALDRAVVSNALRKVIARHRSVPDAEWALPSNYIDRLAKLLSRFEPTEVIARYGWLFTSDPDLPDHSNGDWNAEQAAIAAARLEAIRAIHKSSGQTGLVAMAAEAERPDEVGVALGRSDLLPGEERNLLSEHLGSSDTKLANFSRGFVFGRASIRGREWAEELLGDTKANWTPIQRAEVLVCLPPESAVWDLAEKSGSDAERHYWQSIRPYGLKGLSDVQRAVRKLLDHGRPYTAVDVLSMYARREQPVNPTLIAEALEQAARTPPKDDPSLGSFAYHATHLLELLQAADGIEDNRIAAIEWAFLPLFGSREHVPTRLHRELGRNPGFFAEIVAIVFRSETDEPSPATEDQSARASLGYKLLMSWRTPPGTAAGGGIDADVLKNWVRQAREATQATGRGEIGDQKIGEVLSGCGAGDDDAWPHPAVRDLIEEIKSTDLEEGIAVGRYNSRGVITRDLTEGGAQEHEIAERYSSIATKLAGRWPRTAAMLRRMAESHRTQGRREDLQTELEGDLA